MKREGNEGLGSRMGCDGPASKLGSTKRKCSDGQGSDPNPRMKCGSCRDSKELYYILRGPCSKSQREIKSQSSFFGADIKETSHPIKSRHFCPHKCSGSLFFGAMQLGYLGFGPLPLCFLLVMVN